MSTVYSEIEALFTSGVSEEYLGEDVKLVEHMLQCAALAREAGATDELVVASLLHDIGHLLIPSSVEDYDSGVVEIDGAPVSYTHLTLPTKRIV